MTFWHTAHFTFVVVDVLKTQVNGVRNAKPLFTSRKIWYTLSQNKIKEESISFKKLFLRGQCAETQSKPFNRISYTSCSTGPICSAADSSLAATTCKSSSQNRRESKDKDFKYNTKALFSKLAFFSCTVSEIFTSIAPNFAVLLIYFESFHRKVC